MRDVNVKLSHDEVIFACTEWLTKHHNIVVNSKYEPVILATRSGDRCIMGIEFPGIEPNVTKPETPYR